MSDSSVKRKDELKNKIEVLNSVLANLEKEEYEYGRLKEHELAVKTRNKIAEIESQLDDLIEELYTIESAETKKKNDLIADQKEQEQLEREYICIEERNAIIAGVKQTKEYIEEIGPFLKLPPDASKFSRQRQFEICKILIEANQKYKRLVSFALWNWVKELRKKEVEYIKNGQVAASHVIRDKISFIMEEGTRLSKDFDI